VDRNVEIGWAAGLFEGEGWISVFNTRQRFPGWQVGIAMTDEDVIRKFAAIIGIGVVNGPYFRNGRKAIWQWKVTKRSDVLSFLNVVLPHLGARRASRVQECIADMVPQKPYIA
jgi:hypothetical protein